MQFNRKQVKLQQDMKDAIKLDVLQFSTIWAIIEKAMNLDLMTD